MRWSPLPALLLLLPVGTLAGQEPPPAPAPAATVVPATELEVAGLLGHLAEARRHLTYGPARLELAEVSARINDPALAQRLALQAADFLVEAALHDFLQQQLNDAASHGHPFPWPGQPELVITRATADALEVAIVGGSALHPWSSIPAETMLDLLEGLALAPGQRVDLARFAFERGFGARAEAQLHAALELDASLKDAADLLLAKERREELPHGGYAWHRGQFLPASEVNRRRFLEDVAQRVERTLAQNNERTLAQNDERTLAPDAIPAVSLKQADVIAAPAHLLDTFLPRLEAASQKIVAELALAYETPRDWIQSYRTSPGLRRQRLQQIEQWEPVAKAALELIGRYDKPEQPRVDEFRKQLAAKALQYARLRKSDELAFERADRLEAERLLLRLEALEPTLEALIRYRREYHGDVPDPFPASSPQGAKVHVLPGRGGSGLEEFLAALLLFKAGRTREFLERADELERAPDQVTPWERVVLRDFRWDALDLYNAKVLTSADPEEYACVVATNEYRRTLLLPPFELDERVVIAARGHSQEMKDLGYFGHDSPTDKLRTPTDRVQVAGYGGGAGENCYAGGGGGRGAFEGWYHSPGHHRGMVSAGPHVGVGADTTHALWTQNFAGTDWGWRRHFPTLSVADAHFVGAALDKLGRSRNDNCRAELAALIALGSKALPATCRTLTTLRFHADAEQRGVATRLARAAALVAVQEGIPQATELALQTLMTLLDDQSSVVRAEANVALEQITARDFGFGANLEPPARAAAIQRWRDWWKGAQADFTPRLESKPDEIEPFDAAAPAARSRTPRQSPDAPLKVFSPEERFALARRLGGSRLTEQAVGNALDWLVRHQNPNGSWGGQTFETQCRGEKCGGAASFEFDIGLTGLALLCLIHGGSTVEIGPHQEPVKKGLGYLVSRIQEHGKFTTTTGGWYMYQHALATQALVEGYGTSGDPFLKQAAQKTVDFLIFAQNPRLGGWRYEARTDCDTSVTGWVVLALVAAHDARLKVAGFQGARDWIASVTEPSYYRVGYQSPLDAGIQEPRLTAVGMVCRQALGTRANHPVLGLGAHWCLRQLPRTESIDLYFAYYATLALFQIGGEPWKTWNDALVPALLERAHKAKDGCQRGSFDHQGVHSELGGRIYGTALSCLMLEVYYRYEKFPEVRSLTVTGDIANQAKPLLEKLGSAGTPVERAVAQRRLEEEFGSAAQVPLLNLLRTSQDLEARKDASEVLARVATASLLTDLLALLDDPDGVIQENLHRAVARAADPACIPDLVKRLEDPRSNVRLYAARTLGQLGEPSALPGLLARSGVEADGGVKNEITQALRTLSNRSALDRLLDDAGFLATDAARRMEVREGLRLLESNGLPAKLLAAKEKQSEVYAACLAPLKEQGRMGLCPLLIAALALDDAEGRLLADQMLRALSGRNVDFKPEADERLRKEGIARWQLWWKSAREMFEGGAALER